MSSWFQALPALAANAANAVPAVLVTVAHVQGSAPREAGAKMLVTAERQYDTIGGGHLELQACALARAMLAQQDAWRRVERYALGPGLGQCCGGMVQLSFERIDTAVYAGLQRMAALHAAGRDSWRLVALTDPAGPALLVESEAAAQRTSDDLPPFDQTRGCHLFRDERGVTWLADPCYPPRANLILFGAGHVGAALVRALAELPCRVTWVDEREELFPATYPANVSIECTDVPEAVVDETAPGACFLVMTHSHALDQRLAEAILRRPPGDWFGLIGSTTKRVLFERRLLTRGIAQQRLKDMVCPVGVPGIKSKQPAVIAAAVAAQLLQVWETMGEAHQAGMAEKAENPERAESTEKASTNRTAA